MKQWYTIHTKPNCEQIVATAMEQRSVLTYLPEIASQDALSGCRRTPFFPCYLFIKIDFETVGISYVQWIPGLSHIVAVDDRPVPLADEVIDLIRHKVDEIEATGSWRKHTFKSGDTVRITDGPFRDKLAIFDGTTTSAQRVQVLLNLLGVSRVQVDMTDLEKAQYHAEEPMPKRARRTRGRGRRIVAKNALAER